MRNRLIALSTLLVVVAAPALAADLTVTGGWSRPAAQGGVGAGYLTVTNTGAVADTLLSVTTPAAAKVEVHQSMVMNGMAMMHAMESVDVPARGKALLAPGGYHLMLIGLKSGSKVGDAIPLTLTFAKAGKVTTSLAVRVTAP